MNETKRQNDKGNGYTCSCGADHSADVEREGYPRWHAPRGKEVHFVDECSVPECGKKVCHLCAVTCRICGTKVCSYHTTEDLVNHGLCDGCAGVYPAIPDSHERDVLIEIEAHLASGTSGHYRTHDSRIDLERVLAIARAALAA
jgi:hypothetical protein